MKKALAVIIITAVVSVTICCIPSMVVNMLPVTGITKLNRVLYADSIVASGVVKERNSTAVSCEVPVVVKEVFVSKGDAVKEGDIILTVDKEKTAEKMMQMSNYGMLPEIAAGVDISQYESMMGDIPDEIKSTESGTVESVSVSNGDYVGNGTTILNLIGSDGLKVSADISESDIYKIKKGQNVIITGNGFNNRTYHGVVEDICGVAKSKMVGTSNGTFVETTIKFVDADEVIRVGYTAKVKILTSDARKIDVLPYETVMQDDNGIEYVYVFSNGLSIKKTIETGVDTIDGVEVLCGLTEKDTVLTSPECLENGKYIKLEEQAGR